jgi:TrmH family RNA methyltransferase
VSDLVITSPSNPRLKTVVALRNRRSREVFDLTLLEGREELELALRAGVTPRTLLHCPELMSPGGDGQIVVAAVRHLGAETLQLSRAAFEKVAYREGPDGFLAVVPRPGVELAALDVPPGSLLLIAQGIEKPGNLGAMLRTADAAGVAAVIAADPVTDWGNPNVIRSSKGTVFSVPVASATTEAVVDWMQRRDVRIVATTPDTEVLHSAADLTGSIAVAVGAEKWGLDAALFAAAATKVRIPMAGRADSLNAATAAAIVLFEAVRQRTS